MFDKTSIETTVRNTKGLFNKLTAYPNGYEVRHNSAFGIKLMGSEHIEALGMLATALGLDFDSLGYTYIVKCYVKAGKDTIKVFAPRLVLKKGTCQLAWGDVSVPISELARIDGLLLMPQVIKGDKYTKYSLVLGTELGDVPLPLFPKEGVEPNSAQLAKMVASGEGWSAVLERPYPTDVKTLISAANPEFSFNMVGYEQVEKKGQKPDGGGFTIHELVLESDEGDFYSTKDNNSINSKDIRYWGEQCSPENPVTLTLRYEGIGDYQGKAYTQWGVTCTPVHHQSDTSLIDLLELDDPLSDAYSDVDESNNTEDDLADLLV